MYRTPLPIVVVINSPYICKEYIKSKWKNSFFKFVRQIRRAIDNSYNPAARPPSIRRKTKEIKRRNKKRKKEKRNTESEKAKIHPPVVKGRELLQIWTSYFRIF
ncbi:hypothetical protein TNCV_2097381 [Trichonephila clavipes]|nr:hypothetical protein TNCV_2097381 [Trichonephila clavipes]